ncbi:MAG: hypothetical protein K6B14_11740 [Lachnospiraceae bacterium]|nr:hypothetical protein [Lachnospiraceae bacterium]
MRIKGILLPVLMGATMSVIMMYMNTGRIIFPGIVFSILIQAVVGIVASLIFPAGFLGVKLTQKLLPGANRVVFLLVSTILPSIYFTAILAFVGPLYAIGFIDGFWAMYFSSLPRYIVIGYIISLFWIIIIDMILKKVQKDEPYHDKKEE